MNILRWNSNKIISEPSCEVVDETLKPVVIQTEGHAKVPGALFIKECIDNKIPFYIRKKQVHFEDIISALKEINKEIKNV